MAKVTKGWITDKINGISVNTSYKCNSGNYSNSSEREVGYCVMHYTGNDKDNAINNCKYFQTGGRSASAHLFVDDNTIAQSVELRDSAWAIGCSQGYKTSARNSNSISIEMCTSGKYKISEKTQINGAYTCAYVCKLLGIKSKNVDKYVLRHYDCVKSNKSCPKQYVENPKEWTQFKTWVKNILDTGSHNKTTTVATTTTTATKKTYSGTFPTLPSRGYFKSGDNGTQVKNLQKFLNWAIDAKLTVDGDLGSKTITAVKKFQEKYGLTVDGLFGKSCLAKAKTIKK